MLEKIAKLVALIKGLNPKDEAHFTKSKLPDSRVLAEKLGDSVSAVERDEAFAAFKEQDPDAAAAMQAVLDGADQKEKPAEKAEKVEVDPAQEVVTGQDALKVMRKRGVKV